MVEFTVIGGGLAGCEAAWQGARLGAKVTLLEMKPERYSPAHKLESLAELVCSNSLKSSSVENAPGLLKEEMRLLGSLFVEAAEATRVPAGKALAVDRALFSKFITRKLKSAGVRVVRGEAVKVPEERPLVIATGPLTSEAFAGELEKLLGTGSLFFYDAISPLVYTDTIDFTLAFRGSRYGKGGDDYINCPMDQNEYERFVEELVGAERTPLREFEKIPFFEGCLPVETLAERGPKTLSFGPLKPVGLRVPSSGLRPHAVVQLRQENLEATLYNMVGFQTRLTHAEQKRLFRTIPGLGLARFARLGSVHRNSYIDSPSLLTVTGQLKRDPGIFVAGQLTGVEGYTESAASGLVAGINAWRRASGLETLAPPPGTMTGALLLYTANGPKVAGAPFQPMNANFGLLSGAGGKRDRAGTAARALGEFQAWTNKVLATS